MAKILNVNDYGIGYDQGFSDGHADGYAEGYDAAEKTFQPRVAKLYAELQELNARIAVLEKGYGQL